MATGSWLLLLTAMLYPCGERFLRQLLQNNVKI